MVTPIRPIDRPFECVGNIKARIYHKLTCHHVLSGPLVTHDGRPIVFDGKMSFIKKYQPQGWIGFRSNKDAEKKGYRLCNACKAYLSEEITQLG